MNARDKKSAESVFMSKQNSEKRICFVISPFEDRFDRIFSDQIEPTVKKFKLSCYRADHSKAPVAITEEIFEQIAGAKIIIADLTTLNPNVLYELGIAHTMNKRVIMLVQEQEKEKLPFDIKHIRAVFYRDNLEGWEKLSADLKKSIGKTLEKELGDNPEVKYFSKGPFRYLKHIKDLIEIEQEIVGNICVMTWDLINDLGVYKDTIIKNLKNGTTYKYILPKNAKADMEKLLDEITKEGNSLRSKVEMRYVDACQLECTIVIYGVTDERCERA